jgi:hypothetical protein
MLRREEENVRVVRGGSWKFDAPGKKILTRLVDLEKQLDFEAAVLCSEFRGGARESEGSDDIGFRVVLSGE